jgi:hypothetical protein
LSDYFSSFIYNEIDEPDYIGTVIVDVSALSFPEAEAKAEDERREEDPMIINYLIGIFSNSSKSYKRNIADNFIKTLVNKQELDNILRTNNLTLKDF